MITILLTPLFIRNISASTLTLTITTDKITYTAGETVNIQGNLTLDGEPVHDAIIALEVDTKYGYYVFRTLKTGTVEHLNWLVEISDLYPCDMYGNRKEAFTRGSTGYVNITWKNKSTTVQTVLTAIYLQFSTGSPFTVFYTIGQTSANSSSYWIASFPIPSSSPYGTTTIYASLFTDFPKNGGVPYCPERNATFTITSTLNIASQPHETQGISTSTPSFQTSILLPRTDLILDNYIIYATCKYGTQANAHKIFEAILVGDINNDKKVDMIDIGFVSQGYGSTPTSPNWDLRCDLNSDDKIDMKDIGIVCKYYGCTGA